MYSIVHAATTFMKVCFNKCFPHALALHQHQRYNYSGDLNSSDQNFNNVTSVQDPRRCCTSCTVLELETTQRTLSYATEQLNMEHPRDDYRELLEITVIFLGVVSPIGVRFMKPRAIHKARFMTRPIYSVKILSSYT